MNKIDGEVAHPVVRLHPETGERAVFVSPMFTSHVVGMPPSESDELLAELHAHCAEERFVYEHHWKVGETVLWDNRSSMQCVHSSLLERPSLRKSGGVPSKSPCLRKSSFARGWCAHSRRKPFEGDRLLWRTQSRGDPPA